MATLNSSLVELCADVDADAVKEIISTTLTDAQINAFLNMAYALSIPIQGELGDCGGTTTTCAIIKLLAAHLISTRDRRVKSKSVGGEWSVTYMGESGLGLDATMYGQQAKVLDCSGILATAGMKKASVDVATQERLEDVTLDEGI